MRILHVTYPYISTPPKGYGGSEKVASQIVEGLVGRGHEVHLLATGDSVTKSNLHYVYEKQLTLSKFSPYYNIEQNNRARYLARTLGIDIVHNHMGEFGYEILPGERTITTMHNDYQVRKGTCVAISKNQAKRLGLKKVVYNAIEPEKYIYSDKKDNYMLFLGNCIPGKGVEVAIQLAKDLNYPLVMCLKIDKGTDIEKYYNTKIKPMLVGTEQLITIKGIVSLEEKLKLYSKAKVFLMPISWCLPPNEDVFTLEGMKPIQNVKKGDLIISSDGKYHKVLASSKRKYEGYIYEITPHYGLPIKTTPEHKILTLNGWKKVEDLQSFDALVSPILRRPEIKKINIMDYLPNYTVKKGKIGKFSKTKRFYISKRLKINHIIKITDNFLHFLAAYIAEGTVSTDYLSLTFGNKEYKPELIKYLKKKFKATVTVKDFKTYKTVLIHSRLLSSLFSNMCGHLAKNKKLPDFVFNLSKRQKETFFDYLINYDGHIETQKYGKRKTYTSISKYLIIQLKLLLNSINRISKISERKMIWKGEIRPIFLLKIDSYKLQYSIIQDDMEYSSIRSIKKTKFKGFVYDITTEGLHNFMVNSNIVHNCEPFGLVMLEAMASGTPVVAYNRGSVPEIIGDLRSGCIIGEGNYDSFKEMVREIVWDYPNLITSENCLKQAKKFSVERMVKGYEKIYEDILNGN